MNKKLLFTSLLMLVMSFSFSQTKDELETEQAIKKDSIKAIQKRVDDLQNQIDILPGWKIGAFGTIGANFSEFNNWYSQGTPNNSTGSIGITINPFAKLDNEKYFWFNTANINLGWVKYDDKNDPTDDKDFKQSTDVFNISSLFGYKLSEKIAISTLAEYRTTLLENQNNPGYFDVGVGATWTPIKDLIIVVHPINYNFVFSKDDTIFNSSFGAKIVANYTKSINDFKLMSNLSMFQSYEGSDFSNWTWINSFGYSIWKGIGLGFEVGLRDNKQEALNYTINTLGNTDTTFNTVDNEVQVYMTFGLSYSF